jgi:chitodextrinase
MFKFYSIPPGKIAFALLLACLTTPVFAQVSITFPVNRIVLQRNGSNEARIVINGRVDQPADRVEARLEVVKGGEARDWQVIDPSLSNGAFSGSLTAKGGWYKLHVRALRNGAPVGSVQTVERVGVGEVFLVVGHSNAQGGASPSIGPTVPGNWDRVISIDPNRNRDQFWQYDRTGDPQHLPTEFNEMCTTCGMAPFNLDIPWFWGRLGERLVAKLNVPVLFYNAAFGGTNIEQTYKAAYDIEFSHGFVRYSIRQPYRNIENALKKYIPQTGVRAILSCHGVNDWGAKYEDFKFWHEQVIARTRRDAQNSELAWAIATSCYKWGVNQTITSAQNDLIKQPNNFQGGNLNRIGNDGRTDGLHYNETGQALAAQYWDEALNESFFILAKPQLSRTPTVDESTQPPAPEPSKPEPPVECNTSAYLSDRNWSSMTNAWGPVEKDKSNGEDKSGDGRAIQIRGERYAKGLGVHAGSEITYALGGTWTRFKADIGIDDEVAANGSASVVFEVWADGQRLFRSATLRRNSPIVGVNLDLTGKQQLKLIVTDGGDGVGYDHADWADARLERTCGTQPAGDTQAPTAPANLTSANVSQNGLTLNWSAATDNVGVTNYEVYRGTVLIGTVSGTSFAVTGLTAGTAYGFTVKAKDAAGNTSPSSAPLNVTTQPAPTTPGSGGTENNTTPPPPTAGCTPTVTYVSDLSWASANNGWGPIEKDKSNGENGGGDGRALQLNGKKYVKGLGVHASSEIVYTLGGTWNRFKADLGVDDEVPDQAPASVVFEVWADGQRLFRSATLRPTSATVPVDVDVSGKQQLKLIVTDGGDGVGYDHADWADARLERTCGTQPAGDTQAPTAPANLTSANVSQNGLTLNWSAATDNVGVTNYEVYRGTVLIGTVSGTSFAVTGLTAGTAYGFTVKAKDAAGNTSPVSSTHTVTTPSGSTNPPVTTNPPAGCQEQATYLSDLNWVGTPRNGWGPVEKNRSNGEQGATDGNPLRLNGKTYAKGLGVHAPSEVVYTLGGTWTRFKADVGLDDEVSTGGSVVFEVWADGQRLFQSGTLRANSATVPIDVDVTGKQQLKLIVTNADGSNDSDHADWADARLIKTCSVTSGQVTTANFRTRAEAEPEAARLSAELAPNTVRMAPNPAVESSVVECRSAYLGPTTVELISLRGQVLRREAVEKTTPVLRHPLSVRGLGAGLYLIRVRFGAEVLTGRVQVLP